MKIEDKDRTVSSMIKKDGVQKSSGHIERKIGIEKEGYKIIRRKLDNKGRKNSKVWFNGKDED